MYGKKNYNEILGTSGYRINQVGCFLVSFANILTRFGEPIDPIGLNKIFRDAKIYMSGGDLYWSAVTRANPNIVITATGVGAPTSNDSIVKFTGVNNSWGTHFCMVHDAAKGLIVDSWDGVIKHWSVYGNPDAWASYRDLTPASAPAPVIPPAAVSGDFVIVQPGWGLSHVAKAAGYPNYSTPDSWAAIAAMNGSGDWGSFNAGLKSGQQIRVKNAPAPTPAPAAPADSVIVQAGWGLSHVAQAAGYGDFDKPERWAAIAALNGSNNWGAFNSALKKGQAVKVRGEAPAAPAPQPAPAPVAQPETVDITVQPGWGITYVLKAAGYTKEQWDNEAEWDRVAALNGSATRLKLKPGQVIKVHRQPLPVAQPIPAAAPAPVEAPQAVAPVVAADAPKAAPVENEDGSVNVPVNVVPADPKAYQKTLEKEEKVYIASTSKVVHDMDKLHMDLQLVSGQKVTSGGRFKKADEKGEMQEYIISKKHLELGQWYGIPVDYLGAGKDPNAYVGPLVNDDSDIDDLLDMDLVLEMKEAIGNLSGREKLINFLGKIYDVVSKINIFKKKDKN